MRNVVNDFPHPGTSRLIRGHFEIWKNRRTSMEYTEALVGTSIFGCFCRKKRNLVCIFSTTWHMPPKVKFVNGAGAFQWSDLMHRYAARSQYAIYD
ncbi:hypothetical protein AB6A40_000893 [Gnathostoma spinigerum]|uniref:Uncharacterized protein n=1 Tax=Gnathostoma spinigerum TaxID=75299 RepID=A0ABD6E7N4_9BILA